MVCASRPPELDTDRSESVVGAGDDNRAGGVATAAASGATTRATTAAATRTIGSSARRRRAPVSAHGGSSPTPHARGDGRRTPFEHIGRDRRGRPGSDHRGEPGCRRAAERGRSLRCARWPPTSREPRRDRRGSMPAERSPWLACWSWPPRAASVRRGVARRARRSANWATMFVAIIVQAVPFLVLGVTVSGGDRGVRAAGRARRLLPRRPRSPSRSRRRPASPCPGASAARCRSPAGSSPGVAARRRARVPALRAGDQPGRARRDRGGLPRPAGDGAAPGSSPACWRRSRSGWSGCPGRPRVDCGLAAGRPCTATAAGRVRRHRAARFPPRRRLPRRRRGDRGHAADHRASVGPRHAVAAPGRCRVLALAGAGGRAGDLLGGRRVRRREPHAVLARPRASRSSSSARWWTSSWSPCRPARSDGVRDPLRAAHVRGRRRHRVTRRMVAAVKSEAGGAISLLVGAVAVRLADWRPPRYAGRRTGGRDRPPRRARHPRRALARSGTLDEVLHKVSRVASAPRVR